jgi:Na+/H+ antiporter NhaD/arsenite permease-like protein
LLNSAPAHVIVLISETIVLFVNGSKMPKILEKVEWRTLIFFSCLFIIVGGLEKTVIIKELAIQIVKLVGWNAPLLISTILWISTIASGVVDNIPLVAAFIPMIQNMSSITGIDVSNLWWALAIGAGFGGNGTLIGASANIVAIGVAEARGITITFKDFLKIGAFTMILTVLIANIYLFFRLI